MSPPSSSRSSLDTDISDSDIPSYLHTSPFLPVVNSYPVVSRPLIPKIPLSVHLRTHLTKKTIRLALLALSLLLLFTYYALTPLIRGSKHAMHSLGLSGPACYFPPPVFPDLDLGLSSMDQEREKFAYVLYATDTAYLCNAVMMFESIVRLGEDEGMDVKVDRVLMFPREWERVLRGGVGGLEVESKLLLKARDEYGVTLVGVDVWHVNSAFWFGPNWSDSYTKLLAFNLTQYTRILLLDSDSTLLRPLTHLFSLPPAPVILPRAYWLPTPVLSSHIMLLTPSAQTFAHIQRTVAKHAGHNVYDMEIINLVFSNTCLTLPWREYALLTGEFTRPDDSHSGYPHSGYLLGGPASYLSTTISSTFGYGEERDAYGHEGAELEWDPDLAIHTAHLVHFSDHPLGKPWVVGWKEVEGKAPGCKGQPGSWGEDCRGRNVWLDLYLNFWDRRKDICGSVGYSG